MINNGCEDQTVHSDARLQELQASVVAQMPLPAKLEAAESKLKQAHARVGRNEVYLSKTQSSLQAAHENLARA